MRKPVRAMAMAMVSAVVLLAACTTGSVRPPDAVAPARQAPRTAVVDIGTLDGAQYRIDIPADWNGELVMNAHGYVPAGAAMPSPPEVPGGMQPLIDRGFAVASSDYSVQGWSIGEAVADTERLRAYFSERHGAPEKHWLVGWSMGGLVALASAERHPRSWDGVVAMCGVAVSTEALMARGVLAPLAAFDALYPGVLPQAPDGLADPALPAEADGEAIEAAFAADEERAVAFARRFDLPRHDAAASLWLYYTVLHELAARAGGFPVASAHGAEGTDGDEAALGVRIRRYVAGPGALAYIRRSGALTGSAPVPVVLQPNAVDPIVPARFSRGYAMLAEGRPAQVRVLQGVGEGHCRFPPGTVVDALEMLRAR